MSGSVVGSEHRDDILLSQINSPRKDCSVNVILTTELKQAGDELHESRSI